MSDAASRTRRRANLSMDAALLEEAKALEVNISRAAEEGLAAAVKKARGEQWKRENAAALRAWNAWVEENGLPLEKYRMF
ncbi:MAG: type II toxin-antitoxin system CcdA family antitoxin [Pseudomonadota bacterium]